MNYLIWQILTCLLIAGLFGIFIGWLIWGLLGNRLRRDLAATQAKLTKLTDLPVQLSALEAKHAAVLVEKEAEASKFATQGAEWKQALTGRDTELEHLRASIFDDNARHLAEIQQRDRQAAILTAQVAELQPLAMSSDAHLRCQDELARRDGQLADLQTKLEKLTPEHSAALSAQADGAASLERVHHADAQRLELESLQARLDSVVQDKDVLARRVRELEPFEARTAQLEASLPSRSEAVDRIARLEAELAGHSELHARKDARLAQLEPFASRVPILEAEVSRHVHSHSVKDAEIHALSGRVSELEPFAVRVPDLESEMERHASQVAALEAVAAKLPQLESHISDLEPVAARVPDLEGQISNLAPVAARVPDLEAENERHSNHIATLEPIAARVPDLEAQISNLAPVAARVPHLEAEIERHSNRVVTLEPLAARIPGLEAELQSLASSHQTKQDQSSALLASHVTRLAELEKMESLMPELRSDLANKEQRITFLTQMLADKTREMEQARGQVAELQSLVAAKEVEIQAHLRFCEEDKTARSSAWESLHESLKQDNLIHEQELAELHQRLQMTSRQLEAAQESQATALDELVLLRRELAEDQDQDSHPALTMAAAAGVSIDSNQPPAAPRLVSSHLADDQKRKQIVASGRNAEIKHLRQIVNTLIEPMDSADIAMRAYHLGEQRSFLNGNQQEDWLRAEQAIQKERLERARQSLHPQGLF